MGLKNEGRQGPLNRVWFFPGVCLFEERSALERVVNGVVFYGGWENRVLAWNMRAAGAVRIGILLLEILKRITRVISSTAHSQSCRLGRINISIKVLILQN